MLKKLVLLFLIGWAVYWYLDNYQPHILNQIDDIKPSDFSVDQVVNSVIKKDNDGFVAADPDRVNYINSDQTEFGFIDNETILCNVTKSICVNELTNQSVYVPGGWQVDIKKNNNSKYSLIELIDTSSLVPQKYYVDTELIGELDQVTELKVNEIVANVLIYLNPGDKNELVLYRTSTSEIPSSESIYLPIIKNNSGVLIYKIDQMINDYVSSYLIINNAGQIRLAGTNSSKFQVFEDKVLDNL